MAPHINGVKNSSHCLGVRYGENLRITVAANQGGRKYMEDRVHIETVREEDGSIKFTFCGIFDGHGGHEASEYVRRNLLNNIVKSELFDSDDDDDVLEAIRLGFLTTHHGIWKIVCKFSISIFFACLTFSDLTFILSGLSRRIVTIAFTAEWPRTASGYPSTAGTTVSIAIIRNGKLYTGHVGDSAIILLKRSYLKDNSEDLVPHRLTIDHKPESEDEQARIRIAGGSASHFLFKVALKSGVARVVWTRPLKHHTGPIRRSTPTESIPFLAVARSLGDVWSYCEDTKEFIVSPEPDLAVREITGDDVCLVLASDGLTNVLGPIQVAAVVDEEESVSQIGVDRCEDLVYRDKHTNLARVLVANAIRNWRHLRADNVTAITVMFDSPYADLPLDHPCVEERISNDCSIDKVFIDDPECMIRVSPSTTLKLYTYRTPIVYRGARDPHFSVVEYTGPGFMTHTEERLLEERYRKLAENGNTDGSNEDEYEVSSVTRIDSQMNITTDDSELSESTEVTSKSIECTDRIRLTRSSTPILIENHEEIINTEVKTTSNMSENEEDGTDEEEEMQPTTALPCHGPSKRPARSPSNNAEDSPVPEKRITRSASKADSCTTPSRSATMVVRRSASTVTKRGPCRASCVNVQDKVITSTGSVDIKIHVDSSLTPTFGMITRSRDRNATTLLVDVRSPTPRSSSKRSGAIAPQIRTIIKENSPPLAASPLTGSRKRSHRVLSMDSSGVTPVVHRLSLDTPRRNSVEFSDACSVELPSRVRSAPSTPSKVCCMASSANLEEESGVIKSGSVIAGFAPIKSRKTYYAVLCERALELHESEKTYRKRKSARHLIDLSTAFNVHNDHFDPKLKRCVCLMGPDETLCIKVDDGGKSGDDGRQNTEWYNAIMSALIPSRALRLGRPIQPLEFFECAWDVDVVSMPKLKRPPRTEDSLQNICVRIPEIAGPKRLCFYAHTIILCKRRIEPAVSGLPPSGIPPFQVDDFTEIPRKCVAFFGCQEKFFLMRLGRGAPSGASELWAQCDNEEVALDIHNKLNAIIERESEKERKMNNGIIKPPGLLSLRTHQGHHRDRCHTQPQRTRTSSFMSGRVSTAYSSNSPIGSKPTTPSAPAGSNLGSRAYSISYGSQTPTRNQPPPASAFMSVFPQRQASLDESSVYQAMVPPAVSNPTVTTHAAAEPAGDGGAIYTKAKPHHPEERKLSSVSHTTVEDTTTTPLSTSRNETPTTFDDGYTPMHAAEWSSAGSSSHLIMPTYDRYKLEEVRSYVSDSSDYCSTTGAANGCSDLQSPANPPRAYSFAGRCNLRPTSTNTSIAENTETRPENTAGGLLQPVEDPRKRAFSLGSKTLFQRPFRKISQHSSRQQRVSQTSASSVSLASSEFSSSFGPSSSANHLSALNYSEKDDYSRNRSGSFGSGRSTPHNRKGGAPQDGADHFLEMDFGSGIRRSGSGSVVSVDSPSNCIRSRTSSFGCAIRKDTEVFSYPTDLPEAELTPSQIVLEQARQSSIDETCDYVIPVAPDLEAVKSALAEASEHPHHIGFSSRIDSKSIDMHSSQHFETIEESASLKSSPCSSRSSIAMDDKPSDKAEANRVNDYISLVEHRSDVIKNTLVGPPSVDRPASSPPSKERETSNAALLPQQSPISSTRSKSGIVFSHNLETGKPLLDYASIKPVRAMSY
ncbi:protein phosphatase 2C [Oesophagostomum dentatum]|uniref:Protein phosphatase 2C n=1 Tax=Oesophagostomum dentatum TaxID=61180 RepID=A0A0B1TGW3_OESDE|nr:protein phosphatase 2C [Oesophagostomum dentatum]